MAFFLEPFWPALSGASPWRVGGVGSPARGCFAWKALAMSSDGGGGPPADPNEGSSPPRRRRRRRAAVPSGVSPPTGRQRVEGDAEQEPAAPPAPGGADALPPPLPVGPAAAPVAGAPGAAPALLAAAPAEAAGDADAVAGAETLPEEERPSDGLRRARFYLVTMVWCSVPHYVKPDSITRADFWGLICEAYRAVFPPENENHVGPNLGAVAKELHRNHEVHCMRHSHYHAACEFAVEHRWKQVERYLREHLHIKVHFSAHSCYRTMWDYVTKPTRRKPAPELDTQMWKTDGHPADAEIPHPLRKLQSAWVGRGQQARAGARARMTEMDIYALFKDPGSGVVNEKTLWALAQSRSDSGDQELLGYLLRRRGVPELVSKILFARGAPAALRRESQSRLALLEDTAVAALCVCPAASRDRAGQPMAPGAWKQYADEVVHENGYGQFQVQGAILEALREGRAKQTVVFIVGDTNRAKSFILEGLAEIYTAFLAPDTGSYRLADIEGCEIVWLNEFAFLNDPKQDLCSWAALKELFEGKPVKIGVPKTGQRPGNYVWKADSPVLGTAEYRLTGPTEAQTRHMESRVKYFYFTKYYDPQLVPRVKPCPGCCARWLREAQTAIAARPPAAPPPPPGPQPPPPPSLTERQQGRRRRWAIEKPGGSYAEDDASGLCFYCGEEGHRVDECDKYEGSVGPSVSVVAASSSGSGASSSGSANPLAGRGAFCGQCGAVRSTAPFCTATGRPH